MTRVETGLAVQDPAAAGGWRGELRLRYWRDGDRCIAHDRHHGPLRVLQPLYPEGPAVCHHVLVHPPGGVVGGDVLDLALALEPGSHALLTTPGATRFYRTLGAEALQHTVARVADGARLEWLPMEAIAYPGCRARNVVRLELAPGAETIGWDLVALGLPAAEAAFDRGTYCQQIELPGQWLERSTVDAADRRWLDSPLGWAGRRVAATMWFAAGSALPTARRDALLEAARGALQAVGDDDAAGATSPSAGLVVVRLLAPGTEAAMARLVAVWRRWRVEAWGLEPTPPRIWRT